MRVCSECHEMGANLHLRMSKPERGTKEDQRAETLRGGQSQKMEKLSKSYFQIEMKLLLNELTFGLYFLVFPHDSPPTNSGENSRLHHRVAPPLIHTWNTTAIKG